MSDQTVSGEFSPSHNTVAIRMRKSMTESREGSTRDEGEGEAVQEQELGELAQQCIDT